MASPKERKSNRSEASSQPVPKREKALLLTAEGSSEANTIQ